MPTWEYPCPEPIDVDVNVAAGSVAITATPTAVATVSVHSGRHGERDDDAERIADDVTVEYQGGRLKISEQVRRGLRWRSDDLHVTITVPAGSPCSVRAIAADVTFRGQPGPLEVQTASGNIDAETAGGPVELVTISGVIQVRELTAGAKLTTTSGQIEVTHAAGELTARAVSGGIEIGTADGPVSARTANGQISIASLARGRADLNTVSGDIDVAIAQGTGLYLDLSSLTGRVSSDLEPAGQDGDAELHLHCRTLSGAIRVAKALTADVPN